MFNLNKFAQIKPTTKMLADQNEEMGLSEPKNPMIIDKLLNESRKEPDGLAITEKQLDASGDEPTSITDKQLDKASGSWIKHRDDSGKPLMDMFQVADKKAEGEFEKQNKEIDSDTKFWDTYLDVGKEKINSGIASSQLLSNYDSREAFEKANPMAKKASSELKDADALLYHIYRTANLEGRELNNTEQQMINDINSSKIRILAQTQFDNAADNDFRADQADMNGDNIEQSIQDTSQQQSTGVTVQYYDGTSWADYKTLADVDEAQLFINQEVARISSEGGAFAGNPATNFRILDEIPDEYIKNMETPAGAEQKEELYWNNEL